MRLILTFLLCLVGWSHSTAAPFLLADPAPAGVDVVRFTINGGAPIACVLDAGRPKCDLGQLATAGDFTLVLTWCSPGGIVNTPTGATNTQAGCASSAPFVYAMRVPATASPSGMRVAP